MNLSNNNYIHNKNEINTLTNNNYIPTSSYNNNENDLNKEIIKLNNEKEI